MIRRATIVAVGKLRGWADEGCEDYLKRLRRYFPVDVVEVPEEDMNRWSREEIFSAEAARLSKKVPSSAYLVALDRERGRQVSSERLARKLSGLGTSGRSDVAFVLGGPLGLSEEILGRSDEAISFGEITLPHALARVVLLEQLYRATKIERGEKYHW
ncbi:MAG: 23S rRNA (pseudouridine(1915)-N(3))-methyltransferase RlmH [Rubrobacteraceae bacterium]